MLSGVANFTDYWLASNKNFVAYSMAKVHYLAFKTIKDPSPSPTAM